MWSDAARQAALEVRQANAKGRAQAAAPAGKHLPITPNPQRKVVTAHTGPSVGVDFERKPGTSLSEAARWGVTKGRAIDQRAYGIEGADRTSKTDLGKPMVRSQRRIGEGPGTRELNPGNNAHINEIMRRNGVPAPRVQPTAGQMVAAGLTGPTKG